MHGNVLHAQVNIYVLNVEEIDYQYQIVNVKTVIMMILTHKTAKNVTLHAISVILVVALIAMPTEF